MAERIKRLRIFAGPNGSGKSTLYDYLVNAYYFNKYFHINPDFIFKELQFVLNLSSWPIQISQEDLSGHDVPDEKIVSRYHRTMDNLFRGFTLADRVFFFDNSQESSEGTFKLFAEKKNERLYLHGDETPDWFDKFILQNL
ncbi:MAG: hypothetical protein B6241_15585 [Spirochaetaceae bacterium 4572_59]|nr:MAG: hypothetical protein B6241_15585 [Spirochaetaceae bacterium 4572_59]